MTPLMKLRLETLLETSSSGSSRIALELAFSVIPGHLLPRAALREERHVKLHILAVGLAEIMPGFGNLRIVPRPRKWDKLTPKANTAHLGPSHDAHNSWMVGNSSLITSISGLRGMREQSTV